MISYFEDFKKSMKKRLRIPVSLVEKHFNYFFFLVDIDYTYFQDVIPRVRWLRPLDYEINVDEASIEITTLLVEDVSAKATTFQKYDVAKSKITLDLKTASVIRKKNKIVKKLKEKFGEGENEEDEEEEDISSQAPLALTQGQGEDQVEEVEIEEGAKGEEASEAPEQKKRKAKTLAARKLRKVAKPNPIFPSTRESTRDTTKKDQ